MITLNLNRQEKMILIEVLESYLSDLRMEIAHTDRLEFREMLRRRKALLMKVLSSLGIERKQAA